MLHFWRALGLSALRVYADEPSDETAEMAQTAVDALMRLTPDSPAAHRLRGDVAAVIADLDGADSEAAHRRAIELNPADYAALRRLGRLRLLARDYGEASNLLARASRIDPGDAAMRRDLARALFRLGKLDQARPEYMAAVDIAPSIDALVSLGYLERQLGRLDESARWFHRAVAQGDWYSQIRLAVTYTDLGDLERMAVAARGVAATPNQAVMARALEALFRERFAELATLAEGQLGDAVANEEWLSMAGGAAVMLGEYDRALGHYQRMVPGAFEDPLQMELADVGEALWAAFALGETGRSEQAHRVAEAALQMLESPPNAFDSILRKHYRVAAYCILGRKEQALGEFRAAVGQGSRTILFERFARYERAPMFAVLHGDPGFRALLNEIRRDNAEALRRLHADAQAQYRARGAAPGSEQIRGSY